MPPFLLTQGPVETLDDYLDSEAGGRDIETAERIGRQATIDLITASVCEAAAEEASPIGTKWAGIAAQDTSRRYLVCNAAEGEPGTFKDRALMRANPCQLIEGLMIAAFAIDAAEV